MRVLTVFGTRPEAIKLAPVVAALSSAPGVEQVVCVTGQHRGLLDQVLRVFDLKPDHDLGIMTPNQTLTHVTSAVLQGVGEVVDRVRPDWLVVQGDTTTAFAAALAGFYRKVAVAHVEAGLRTGNLYSPWPEEANRKLVTQLAALHFAPTRMAAENLRCEAVPEASIHVTGNTVIDALLMVDRRLATDAGLREQAHRAFGFLDPGRKLVLVTGHRRENFDGGLEAVCRALSRLAERPDVQIVYPLHPNPAVRAAAERVLAGRTAVHLVEPLEYLPFVALMKKAFLIVSDSGGIQEEAPALGKPVLVTRDTTERPEAVLAGTARLVGTDAAAIHAAATELLDDPRAYAAMSQAGSPFGDGHAAGRIVALLSQNKTELRIAV